MAGVDVSRGDVDWSGDVDWTSPQTWSGTRRPLTQALGLPPAAYTSDEFFEVEQQRVFDHAWVCVGITDEVADAHRMLVRRVGARSVLITRNGRGELRGFLNACRHRGTELAEADCDISGTIRCPYHRWGYDLDGTLVATPFFDEVPRDDFDRADHGLHAVRVDTWGALLFVCLAPETPPLRDWLGDLDRRMAGYHLDTWVTRDRQEVDIAANWKLISENFQEYYHLRWVHPELSKVSRVADHYRYQGAGMYCGQTTTPVSGDERNDWLALPPAVDLDPSDEVSGRFVAIFPNVLLSVLPNHAWVMRLDPLAPGTTRETCTLLLPAATGPTGDDVIAPTRDFWLDINGEDIDIVQRAQRGLARGAVHPGPLAPRFEEPLHRFHTMLADCMTAPSLVDVRIPDGDRPGVEADRWGAAVNPAPPTVELTVELTESAHDYDAVIIGAGVIGCAVAYELSRRGWRTLSVDKGPAAGFGSTSASSAVVRFSYSTDTGVAAAWEGMHYWKNWPEYLEAPDEYGHAQLVQCGMAILVTGEGGHDTKVTPIWDRLSVPYERWTADELRARMPIYDLGLFGPPARPDDDSFWQEPRGELVGAVFSPDAGYVDDPQLAAHNLQRAAEAKGAEFRFRREVTGFLRDGNRCTGVELADGATVSAQVVVNVAGPHSSKVNQLAGVYDGMNIKTESVRHETYHVPGPPDFDFTATGFSTADDDNGIYFRPQPGNNILVGTTDPPCDPNVPVDADEDLGELSSDGWETNTMRINKRVPSLGVPLPHDKKGIVDRYDKSDDWIPIYDRTDLDGFYVAIGTSGNQFKNAGVVGHMMAELIVAVEAGRDHDAEPLQLTGRYTGLPLDLATFRRNRPIDPRSSMTVHG